MRELVIGANARCPQGEVIEVKVVHMRGMIYNQFLTLVDPLTRRETKGTKQVDKLQVTN